MADKKTMSLSNGFICLAILVLLITTFVAEQAEAYLFPRLIAILMMALSALLFFDNAAKQSTNQQSLLPGLLMIGLYVISLNYLGFYSSSLLVFFAITLFYKKNPDISWRKILKKLIIAILFTSILYLLFAKLLQVRTPTGWLF